VGVVFESEIVWEKFRTSAGFREPVIVHFPDYTKGTQIHSRGPIHEANIQKKLS